MITDEYFAGFFDGEGCVSIAEYRGCYYRLAVVVGVLNRQVVDLLHKTYGGSVHYKPHIDGIRTECRWYIGSNNALPFLKRIYPYSIIKRNQIAVAILFQEQFNTLTVEEKHNLMLDLKAMKKE